MNSLSIRIILICGLVALTLCALYVLRSRLATRLFLALQLLAGVLLVIFPEAANWMAEKVGVGRGTDLIFYLMILVIYGAGIVIVGKFSAASRPEESAGAQVEVARLVLSPKWKASPSSQSAGMQERP